MTPQPSHDPVALATRQARSAPLVVVTEPQRTPLVLAVVGPIEIGRDPSGLVLLDPQISRRHLRIEAIGQRVVVSDLGSRNGTTVDGRPLLSQHALAAGEIVRFGQCMLRVVGDHLTQPGPLLEAAGQSRGQTSIDRIVAAVIAGGAGALEHDSGTVTVVFSEVWDAAKRAAELGDARWHEVLAVHDQIVRRMLTRHDGAELHSHGDCFLTYFHSGRSAVGFAVDTLRAFAAHAAANPLEGLRLRAGVHVGEAVSGDDGSSLRGLVTTAAGIATRALSGEILVSSLVREIVESRGDQSFAGSRSITMSGLSGEVIVHLVRF
jgi:class 3 adenylate cyclase